MPIMTNPVSNQDTPVIPTIRKLRSHPSARLADELPSAELVARHIYPAQGVGCSTHWFWIERKGTRQHDTEGQATLRWRGRTYNVARVLLQHRHRSRLVRAVNRCGLPQCVKPDHWSLEPSFLGAVSTAPSFATIQVGGVWRLSSGGNVVERDVAFVVYYGRHLHVLRALYEEDETTFLTACGINVDPAYVVATAEQATCPACLC